MLSMSQRVLSCWITTAEPLQTIIEQSNSPDGHLSTIVDSSKSVRTASSSQCLNISEKGNKLLFNNYLDSILVFNNFLNLLSIKTHRAVFSTLSLHFAFIKVESY